MIRWLPHFSFKGFINVEVCVTYHIIEVPDNNEGAEFIFYIKKEWTKNLYECDCETLAWELQFNTVLTELPPPVIQERMG